MTDSQNAKPTELSIIAAASDGYIIVDPLRKAAGMPGALLFAGTLSHCLAYMESAFQPPMIITADAPPEDQMSLKPGPVTFVPHGAGGGEALGSVLGRMSLRERAEMLDRNQTVTSDPVDLRGLDPARNDYWDKRPGRAGDVVPPTPTVAATLDDVLDLYRLEGQLAGVQVFSRIKASAWIGEMPDAGLYHFATGSDCIEILTKWLLDQRG